MSRTLSATTTANTAKVITKPYWLVYIGFGTPLYYSSGPNSVWSDFLEDEGGEYYVDLVGERYADPGALTFTPNDMVVSLSPDHATGTLKIQNTDYVFGQAVATADGISDTPIKIYEAHGTGDVLTADIELLFDGVGDSDSGSTRWITVSLKPSSGEQQYPFIRCTKEVGFNYLPPDGTTFSWEGEQLTLTVD